MTKSFSANVRATASAIVIALATVNSASPVFAQADQNAGAGAQANDAASGASDDIVITARRRAENAMTVPVAVTAFGELALREKAITSTLDLTYVTPGFNAAPQTSRDTPTLVIRTQRRSASGAGAPGVVTYFADVPLPNDGSVLPTFDIASVQVLKGPQGTLFGRNTTGGALLVTPKAPSYDFGGYAEVTLGSYDQHNFEAALNVPIVNDAVALRIAAQIARRDGYTKNLGVGGDLDDQHANNFRASLLIEPFEGVSNTTIFDYSRAKESGTGLVISGTYPNPGVPGGGNARTAANAPFFDCGIRGCDIDIELADQQARGIRTVATNIAPESNRLFWGVANTTVIEMGDVTLKNVFGYRKNRVLAWRDYDGTPLALFEQFSKVESEQLTNELQLFGKLWDDRVDWIVGGFYLNLEPQDGYGRIDRSAFRPGQTQTYAESYISSESKAVFGQVSLDLRGFLDGVKLNLGGRLTKEIQSGCNVSLPTTVARAGKSGCVAAGGIAGRSSDKAFTWTAGIDYQLSDDVFTYVVARRGYRAGGFNRGGLAPSLAAFEGYGPEYLTDIEGGVKANWRMGDVRSRFNLAVFRGKYSSIQRQVTLGPNFDGDNNPANDAFALLINPGKATISGAEFDASFTLDGFTFSGFGAYTNAKYDSFQSIPVFQPLLGNNPILNKFPYSPEWTLGAAVRYSRQLSGNLGELAFNANYFWSDKVYYAERPRDIYGIQKPYNLVNMKLDWNDIGGSGVDAGFYLRNVFNTKFQSAGGILITSITATTMVYNEPRVAGIQLRYSFGGR